VHFAERVLATLRAKGDTRLLRTEDARVLVGLTHRQWERLARLSNFPKRHRVGRLWCINGRELADFFTALNAVHAGMTLSQIAKYAHSTTATLHNFVDSGRFPKPIGFVHGHPRFARATVEEWFSERLGGLKPPAFADEASRKKKKA
jgi:predicted DNA-binding transcriptional regulator AlpA